MIDESKIPEELRKVVRTVLAVGNAKEKYVFPAHVVDQLNETVKPEDASPIRKAAAKAVSALKLWYLAAPQNIIPYMFRNATGDLP